MDLDCITWIYTSSVDLEGDIYAGLVGPLLVCKRGTLDSSTGKQVIKRLSTHSNNIYLSVQNGPALTKKYNNLQTQYFNLYFIQSKMSTYCTPNG